MYGKNTSSSIPVITIDPTKLSEANAKLLHCFLQADEKKPKAGVGLGLGEKEVKMLSEEEAKKKEEEVRRKGFIKRGLYPFQENGQDIYITFTQNLMRITKGYTHVLKLEEESEAKNLKDDEMGWLDEGGKLTVCWIDKGKACKKSFPSNKVEGILKRLRKEGKDSSNRELIKDITSKFNCAKTNEGGEKEYTYAVLDEEIGRGANGAVYKISGRLKHCDDRMKYSAAKEVIKEQKVAGIYRDEVAPEYYDSIDKHKLEFELSQQVERTTEKGTFIKDSKGRKIASYMVQREFPGETLEKILEKDQLTLEQRCLLSIKLIEALKRLHDKGIIHRDIKPSNIMVDLDTMEVNIADLGEGRKKHQPDGKYVGTHYYMSHEMLFSPRNAGKKSDICSLGFVLKELWKDKKRKEELKQCWTKAMLDARKKEKKSETGTPCDFDETILDELGENNTAALGDILAGTTHPNSEERSLTKALQGFKKMSANLGFEISSATDLHSAEISDSSSEEDEESNSDLSSGEIYTSSERDVTLKETKLEKKPGFFERLKNFFEKRPWLRDILIGAGIALAVAGAIAIIAVSWGAATPIVLGVGATVGTSVGLTGTAAIGVGLGMIAAGAVIVNSIIAGVVGKITRYFQGKSKPPREPDKKDDLSVDSQRSYRIIRKPGPDHESKPAPSSERDLAGPQLSSSLHKTGGSTQPNPENPNEEIEAVKQWKENKKLEQVRRSLRRHSEVPNWNFRRARITYLPTIQEGPDNLVEDSNSDNEYASSNTM
jgi:serine/threonine protein kinase